MPQGPTSTIKKSSINSNEYKRFVICYDITSDKRRRHVVRCLEDYGSRVQFSVFEAILNQKMLTAMQARLNRIISATEDAYIIYPASNTVEDHAMRGSHLPYPIPMFTTYYIV